MDDLATAVVQKSFNASINGAFNFFRAKIHNASRDVVILTSRNYGLTTRPDFLAAEPQGKTVSDSSILDS
jgi:hypothetical protein